MVFNYRKLRGKIIEKYGTITEFVKIYGVSQNTFSRKLNNRLKFSADDIIKIVNILEIPESEIKEYFFNQIV